MKILQLVHCYPPAIGGTEIFIKNLSENLVKKYNDEVTVLTTNGYNCDCFYDSKIKTIKLLKEKTNNINIFRFKTNIFLYKIIKKINTFIPKKTFLKNWLNYFEKGPISIKMFFKSINFCDYDIIMCSSFPLLQMLYGFLAAKLNDIPIVFRGHFHIHDKTFDNPIFYSLINNSNKYFCATEAEKTFLINKNINENKLKTIPCGIDYKNYKNKNSKKFKQKYKIPEKDKVVLFVGQKILYKGIKTLIKSMFEIWDKKTDVTLLICGSSYSNYIK